MFNNQIVIPAISSHQSMKTFIKSDLTYGLIMGFQLAQLDNVVRTLKQNGKKVLVHLELIKGLSNDDFGAIYLIQELRVDGIITTKPRVIELCKKRNVFGIMRFFLKDKLSLDQSITLVNATKPHLIEVLPAMPHKLHLLKPHINIPMLVGGLIESEEEVRQCVESGAFAITTSKESLWHNNDK